MDWTALGESLAKLGLPLLGAALPVPGGAAIGTALAAAIGGAGASGKPEDILAELQSNATALASAKQFELEHQATMLQLTLSADSEQLQAVNATLQQDAKGQSWLQRNHHALESMATTGLIGAVYFVLPLCHLPVPEIPNEAFLMLGAILGVSAWHGGMAKREAAAGE